MDVNQPDAALAERALAEREFFFRRQVQKLRWLGFEDKAVRVATAINHSRRAGAPTLALDPPETD